ncbi:hypothetical protein P8452_49977 [Trifolium repens]|nr:hypothetical protein P8452_49977 [Trifolium repens]
MMLRLGGHPHAEQAEQPQVESNAFVSVSLEDSQLSLPYRKMHSSYFLLLAIHFKLKFRHHLLHLFTIEVSLLCFNLHRLLFNSHS